MTITTKDLQTIDSLLDLFQVCTPKTSRVLSQTINNGFNEYKCHYPYNAYNKTVDGKCSAILEFALAGFKADETYVKIHDGFLIIGAKQKTDESDENAKIGFIHRGISMKDMEVKFKILSGCDKKNITADFVDGILTVEIPYKEKKEQNIEVKVG